MESQIHKPDKIWIYLAIFVALMALLVATVAAASFDLGRANTPVALIIAVIKALLVILFFMHVRHSSRLTWVFVAAGFLWLSLLLCLTMTDYASR
ncbi:MAG TPA: cytochrome C oxidase subunit IV family protein [Humisphaera sp.]|nr:cytochrome C oxidase subunit IV family protein [Humisphaera sp.]